jgi:hypothetical protein
MSAEHPVEQTIIAVQISPDHNGEEGRGYGVGLSKPFGKVRPCTRIEATTKSGMHADIPYIRVWNGDACIGELCQHSIVGIYFEPPEASVG